MIVRYRQGVIFAVGFKRKKHVAWTEFASWAVKMSIEAIFPLQNRVIIDKNKCGIKFRRKEEKKVIKST